MALEVSFRKEIASLRLGGGQEFRGEGILAVTKALLQSGVSYVGGYQGAPVSHLLDVLLQAEDLLAELAGRGSIDDLAGLPYQRIDGNEIHRSTRNDSDHGQARSQFLKCHHPDLLSRTRWRKR